MRTEQFSLLVGSLGLALCTAAEAAQVAHDPWAELEAAVVERGVDLGEITVPGRLTDEMRAWAHSKVPTEAPQDEALNLLLWALVDPFGLKLVYDASFTGTAEEVWSSRKANCLGFTHLFVGLSRELGLPTYYVRWTQIQNFRREGDLVLISEHVSAGMGVGPRRQVLEFGAVEGLEGRLSVPISDLEALARHYSNRSAELLQGGDLETAKAMAEVAVRLEPTLAEGWVNLGVVRRRSGDLDGAREAYLEASVIDPDHLPAYQNLAVLMQIQGEEDVAHEILSLLDRRDSRNPYVYLALGDLSLNNGQLEEADHYYRRAARLAPDLAEARAARGLVALESGNEKAAQKWLKKAAALDPEDARTRELATKVSRTRDRTE